MTRLVDDELIDLSTSCTKDHAVLRLLGWSRDTFYPKYIQFDTDGNYLPNQLYRISHNTIDLKAQLQELLDQARQSYLQALPEQAYSNDYDFEKNMSSEALDDLLKKQQSFEEIRELIERAREMAMDIDEELGKGEHSQLKRDVESTQATGSLHITIRSLERWQKTFYAPKTETKEQSTTQHVGSGHSELMAQLSRAIAENPKKLSKADLGLYITLGLAIEAIAEKFGKPYSKDDESPVVAQIAELITRKHQNTDGKTLIPGQGVEMVRTRLALAMKVLPKFPKSC